MADKLDAAVDNALGETDDWAYEEPSSVPNNSVRSPDSFDALFNKAWKGDLKPEPRKGFGSDEIRMGFDKDGDINMTPLDKRLTPFQEEMQRLQEEAKAVRSQRDAIDLAVETVWQSHPMNSLRTAPLEAKAAKLAIDFAKANPGISLIKAIRHGIDEALNVGPG